MSVDGDNPGLPEVEEAVSETEPVNRHLASEKEIVCNAQGDETPVGDAAIGAGILAKWAQSSKLFEGRANEEALNNFRDHLDPRFVVALEWAQQDPDAVRKFLGIMKNAIG